MCAIPFRSKLNPNLLRPDHCVSLLPCDKDRFQSGLGGFECEEYEYIGHRLLHPEMSLLAPHVSPGQQPLEPFGVTWCKSTHHFCDNAHRPGLKCRALPECLS